MQGTPLAHPCAHDVLGAPCRCYIRRGGVRKGGGGTAGGRGLRLFIPLSSPPAGAQVGYKTTPDAVRRRSQQRPAATTKQHPELDTESQHHEPRQPPRRHISRALRQPARPAQPHLRRLPPDRPPQPLSTGQNRQRRRTVHHRPRAAGYPGVTASPADSARRPFNASCRPLTGHRHPTESRSLHARRRRCASA